MNDQQNGIPTQLPDLPVVRGDPNVIRTLEEALGLARQGRVVGVTVVMALGPDQISMASAGALPSTLIAGMQQLSRQILDAMFAKRSSLIQPMR